MALIWIALGISACSTLPENVHRPVSHALADPERTALGRLFLPEEAANPGRSGFMPVAAGTRAFLLRDAFAGLAERTLDLQYYIWADDLTGRTLLRSVMRAADRGVRVRLLLDDVHASDAIDIFGIADAHPRIEVRLFNPLANRDMRIADVLVDWARINHRMHNKAMIVDNALALTGGRNIGDHYFAVDEASNFRDLDLLVAGPAVRELSGMFDIYWNSEWAFPIAAISGRHYDAERTRMLREFLDARLGEQPLPFSVDTDISAMRARIEAARAKFHWGAARVVFDDPGRVEGEDDHRVAQFLFDTANGVREELLIETGYLIPGDGGVTVLAELVKRGVTVRILTNSLATTDVAAAHAGYMGFRDDLLGAGVELHELRPDASSEKARMTWLTSASDAALHTKALVYDRRSTFVGSFNLDPRSLLINTEIGILIESEALAADIAALIEEGMQPANSYRLAIHEGEIRWRTENAGTVTWLEHEPETSWWQRFVVNVLALLPIEGQL